MKLGYALSSEEHAPDDLVRYAARAEEAGFEFAVISDHYHPWTDRQGSSPFVWSVLGAIAQATSRLHVGTGVSCPTTRLHPAIIAQAAATMGALMPGRFFLGLGTGESLNEHILGRRWPPPPVRLEMLEEAVKVIQLLWQGGWQNFHGTYFTVEYARLYTLPEVRPRIIIAAGGRRAAEMAGRAGDGIISASPDAGLVAEFKRAGGRGKAAIGQFKACWARDEATARRIAREWWPNSTLNLDVGAELPLPRHFEELTENVTEETVARQILCGPDPHPHIERFLQYVAAGYTHVYVHQVGPDQEGFFQFYEHEVIPRLREFRKPIKRAA